MSRKLSKRQPGSHGVDMSGNYKSKNNMAKTTTTDKTKNLWDFKIITRKYQRMSI